MRIITGQYKGRHFDIPRSFKARPTTDFAKENIFNVLQNYIDFEDATALDLFAGTGSISLELVSRGCSRVISVEADRDHANFIRECFKKLGEDKDLLIRGDVFRFLRTCKQKFDFIFADPPYALEKLPRFQTSYSMAIFSTKRASSFSNMARTTISPIIQDSWSIEVTEA